MPLRRAGSPQHFSSLPRMAKSQPARCRIFTSERAIFCECWSKLPAQPTQSRMSVSPFSASSGTCRSLAQSLARVGVDAPGIALVFQAAVQGLEFLGEPGFHQHPVLAHAHDLGDVLVEHRADLHAGAAGGAVPDLFLADHLAEQFFQARRIAAQLAVRIQQVVLQLVQQGLGRQGLARLEGRADVVAAPALGAGEEVEQVLAASGRSAAACRTSPAPPG